MGSAPLVCSLKDFHNLLDIFSDIHKLKIETVRTCCKSENLKGGDHMEDLGIDGMIILEWIL
jgi:hypothetical protein